MEYLFIIAFVGLIVFKVIKGSSRAKKEETGKTMLPGRRTEVPVEEKRVSEAVDSWEQWFADESRPAEISVKEYKSAYRPAVATLTPEKKKKQKPADLPEPPSAKSIRLDSKEELRRAILYSEIIQRKY